MEYPPATDPAPDYRALCARLLWALEEVRVGPYPGYIRCVIDDARIALAQPALEQTARPSRSQSEHTR